MLTVIVPNDLRNAILAKIDEQLEHCPAAKPHREGIYEQLLGYFYEHGVIPEFQLTPKPIGETEDNTHVA